MLFFYILKALVYIYTVYCTIKGIVQDTKKTNLALIEEACEISLSKAGQTILGNIVMQCVLHPDFH